MSSVTQNQAVSFAKTLLTPADTIKTAAGPGGILKRTSAFSDETPISVFSLRRSSYDDTLEWLQRVEQIEDRLKDEQARIQYAWDIHLKASRKPKKSSVKSVLTIPGQERPGAEDEILKLAHRSIQKPLLNLPISRKPKKISTKKAKFPVYSENIATPSQELPTPTFARYAPKIGSESGRDLSSSIEHEVRVFKENPIDFFANRENLDVGNMSLEPPASSPVLLKPVIPGSVTIFSEPRSLMNQLGVGFNQPFRLKFGQPVLPPTQSLRPTNPRQKLSVTQEIDRLKLPPNLTDGDWLCPSLECKNVNFRKRTHCNICGVVKPIFGSSIIARPAHIKRPEKQLEGDWICSQPSCKNYNFATRTICNLCGSQKA